jgi:electron transfer DM13
MKEMAWFATSFAGHPLRIGAAVIAVLVAASIAWYLGSPLFIRTYRSEALPEPTATAAVAVNPGRTAPSSSSPAGPRVLATGELRYVDAIHNGNGSVRILDVAGQRLVRFEDVAVTNAPDVHVYLSREAGGTWSEAASLYLGPLKATNGSFNYEIPPTADVASYQSVVVWCRAFRVLITWADLRAT